jgi:FimV-like protein
MLAQVYLRKEDYKSARQLLEHVSSHPDGEETVRRQAERLLGQVTSMEQQMARIQAERDSRQRQRGGRPALTEEGEPGKIDPSYYLRESLRPVAEGETQLQALLIRVDCDAKGIFFVLKMGDRLLRLKTDNFERVEMTTFSEDAGREMTCGPRKTENNVIVSYVASAEGRSRVDGVIKAIEFVPKDFQLKP